MMDDHEDVSMANVSESTVTVSVSTADETLMEPLGCEGQIEGSLCGACDGGEIMVELVGSDVFVDGVGTHGGGGNSNEEAGGEVLVSAEEGLQRETGSVDGGGDVVGDLTSQVVGEMGDQIWNPGIETGVEGSLAVANSSGEQTQVVVDEDTTMVVRKVGLERGLVEEGVERGRETIDYLTSDEAQNPGIDNGVEGSLANVGSSGEQTEVAVAEKIEATVSEGSERGFVEEGVERGVDSVDGMGGVIDDLKSRKVSVLDDEVCNLGIETSVECSSVIAESLSVQTQVVAEEVVVMVSEDGLNPKDEVPGSGFLEGSLSCTGKDQSSMVEMVCGGTRNDGVVCENSNFLDKQTQVAVGGEVTVMKKEEIFHSKVEVMETDALDGNLHCSKDDQQLKTETMGVGTQSQGGALAYSISSCEPTHVVVGGEVSAIDNKVLSDPSIEAPKTVGLGGILSCLENDQNLKVEMVCGSTEKENPDGGNISAMNGEKVLNSKAEVTGVDAYHGNLHCSVEDETVHGGAEKDDQVADRGEIDVMHSKEKLNSHSEVPGSGALNQNLCCSLKDQELKAEAVDGGVGKDSVVSEDSESSGEQTQVAAGDSVAINDKVLILNGEVPKINSLDEILSCSENNQNLKVEAASESQRKDDVVRADLESPCTLIQVADRGEVSAVDNEEVLNAKVEVLGLDALDDNLYSAKDQELKVVTVGGNTENDIAVCAKPESSSEGTQVVNCGEVAAMDNKEVSNPEMEVPMNDSMDGILACSENDQCMKVVTACGSTVEDGIIRADPESSYEQARVADGGEVAVMDTEEVFDFKVEVPGIDSLDGNTCSLEKDQVLKVETIGESADKNAVCADLKSSVEQTENSFEGDTAAVGDKEVPKFEGEVAVMDGEAVVDVLKTDALNRNFCSEDQKSNVESLCGSTGKDGIVHSDLEPSFEGTPVVVGGEVAVMEREEVLDSKAEALVTNALDGNLCCAEKVQKLKFEMAGSSTKKGGVHADPESSLFQGIQHEVALVDSRESLNTNVEILATDFLHGSLSFPEIDRSLKAATVLGGAEKDGFVHADSKTYVEQILVVRGEITVIDDKQVSNSKAEALGGDMCCLHKDEKLDTLTVGGSTEKDGVAQENPESSGEQTRVDVQVQSPVIDNEGTFNSTVDFPRSNALDWKLSHPENELKLKVGMVGGSSDKDGVAHADPPESSCRRSVVVEGDFAVMNNKKISNSLVEVPACNALDENMSLSEKDLESTFETVGESTVKDGVLYTNPSLGIESSLIGDSTTFIMGTNSGSLEENTSVQYEKQEAVVLLAETLAHEVDGDQSTNPLIVDEISKQGASITAISDSVVEVNVGSQAALNCASFNEGDPVTSCVTAFVSPLPDGNQSSEVHAVSNHISLPDGDQTMGTHVYDMATSNQVVDQAVEAKDESSGVDENHITGAHVPEAKISKFSDNESIVGSLVVDLDRCPSKDGNSKSQGEVFKENICPPDEAHFVGDEVQRMGGKVGYQLSECLDESAAGDLTQVGLHLRQEIEVEEQVTDAEQVGLHGGREIEVEEQVTDTEQPKTIDEKIIRRAALKPGSSVIVHQASFQLPTENEGEFSVSDLVWGKVRSHPWWPGQIFDPSDSSEKAMKYHKKDCFLVAYFGDRTFAWNEASLLKPFRTHFSQIERQSNSEAIHNAVNCALEEVSRRVELGLACSCIPKDVYDKIEFQIVENTGIRQESSRRDGVDKSTSVNSFEPDKLVEYIKTLARSPCGVGDRLDLVIAKAQLLAFCRLKGYCQLPEFQFCGGLLENDADTSQSEDKKHSSEVIEHATHVSKNDEKISSGKLKSQNSSSHKRKHNLKDSVYPRKKERRLSELMGEMTYSPDGENWSDGKATTKSISSSFVKKRKAVDSFADDSVVQDRRKSISVAKVFSTASPSPKQSFKVGECIRRVASQLTGSPLILKCSGERFQKVDGGSDKPFGAGCDVSFETPEDSRRRRVILSTENSSIDEMLSQLHLAARDPMKGYSFLNIIITFFSDFRSSVISNPYSGRGNFSMDKGGGGRKKKSAHSIIGSPETFEFEDMNDSYWTDRVIQNHSEEQPSHSSQNRKGEYQLVTVEPEKSLHWSRRLYSRKQSPDWNHELIAEKPASFVDERKRDLSPTELILNFPEVDSVPSETNLNKMFRRFGPLQESETEVDRETSRARVVFKRCSDAEVAFSSAGTFNIFGPMVVNYQLSYSPSIPFKALPVATTEGQEDAT